MQPRRGLRPLPHNMPASASSKSAPDLGLCSCGGGSRNSTVRQDTLPLPARAALLAVAQLQRLHGSPARAASPHGPLPERDSATNLSALRAAEACVDEKRGLAAELKRAISKYRYRLSPRIDQRQSTTRW
jgi:hypothetical protein